MQEHFERLFFFSEMKVSVALKHCAVKIKKTTFIGHSFSAHR